MIVIPPVVISNAMLTSSTVPEPHAPSDYSAGTTYGAGDFVTDSATMRVYESIDDGNVGNTPAISPLFWRWVGYKEVAYNAGTTYAASTANAAVIVNFNNRLYESLQDSNTGNNPYTSPEWWEELGHDMRWAMFDTLRNTATVGPSPLVVVLTPGVRIDTLAALGVSADSIRVQMSSAGASVYDETADLITREAFTYYDYFFKPFNFKRADIFQNLPPYTNGIITVTFTRSAGNVACGALCIGYKVNLGTTLANPRSSALNFSTVERDSFGNSVLIQRRTVPKTNQSVLANSRDLETIIAARMALNAVPAVWAGLTDSDSYFFPPLLILGVYKEMSLTLQNPDRVLIELELEEV